jgi:hypothetical protein
MLPRREQRFTFVLFSVYTTTDYFCSLWYFETFDKIYHRNVSTVKSRETQHNELCSYIEFVREEIKFVQTQITYSPTFCCKGQDKVVPVLNLTPDNKVVGKGRKAPCIFDLDPRSFKPGWRDAGTRWTRDCMGRCGEQKHVHTCRESIPRSLGRAAHHLLTVVTELCMQRDSVVSNIPALLRMTGFIFEIVLSVKWRTKSWHKDR